jgi:hypothetical protein
LAVLTRPNPFEILTVELVAARKAGSPDASAQEHFFLAEGF